MKYKSKIIHENYHIKTHAQRKKISKNNFTYRIIIGAITKYLLPNKKVLDIGCGAGTLDFFLADKVKTIRGIDISESAIQSCLESKKNLGIKNVEFEYGYFPNKEMKGKFDVVIFTEVIEHLEDDKSALREIHNILSNKGILFLTTVSNNAPLHRLGLTREFDKRVGHLRRYEMNEILELLQASGFKIKETSKTEGILRNFLFTNKIAGKIVRFVKFSISDLVTLIDNLTIPIFGESNYIIVAEKL